MVASCGMAVVCSAPKGEKGSIVPRNGLSTASVFELVPPLAEPTTDRAVMRAYRVNPLSIFPARAYEEDRVVRPFFGRPSVLTSRAEDIRHVLLDNADNYRRSRAGVRILRPLGDGLFMAIGRRLAGATPHHRSRFRPKRRAKLRESGG